MKLLITAFGISVAMCTGAAADTISVREIANGISDSKTEIQQQSWWRGRMAGQFHEITGKVKDVEEGTFSGYWVTMALNRDIDLRCGLDEQWKGIGPQLRKGQNFTCKGEVANTWTSAFGIMFSMDYTGPKQNF